MGIDMHHTALSASRVGEPHDRADTRAWCPRQRRSDDEIARRLRADMITAAAHLVGAASSLDLSVDESLRDERFGDMERYLADATRALQAVRHLNAQRASGMA
jgi:hypothetical protein